MRQIQIMKTNHGYEKETNKLLSTMKLKETKYKIQQKLMCLFKLKSNVTKE